MNAITLYIEDLNTQVKDLHPLHRERLLAVFPSLNADSHAQQSGQMTVEQFDTMKLRDALNLIPEHENTYWVSKYRDLSDVKPLSVKSDYFAFDRAAMQPLLDALEKGDFELAEALTPSKYRLCGYKEYKEARKEEERGIGWAGQFADIVVPPGIYPVFAREFQYHEAKHCYTNELRSYPGLFTWVEGQCIASSDGKDEFPYPRTLIESPYCYSVAHSILNGEGDIHLIYPFKAVEVQFKDLDGKDCVTHKIIDSRLPKLVQENPMKLRGFGPVAGERVKPLAEQISAAEKRTEQLQEKTLPGIEKGR